MQDTDIHVALFLTDILSFQGPERKLIKPLIELSCMISKQMIGSKCPRSKKEDITIQAAISTISSYMFLEAFKTQIRSIHARLKELISILKILMDTTGNNQTYQSNKTKLLQDKVLECASLARMKLLLLEGLMVNF